MGALLASGTGAAVFGSYKLGEFGVEKLESWAGNYCSSKMTTQDEQG